MLTLPELTRMLNIHRVTLWRWIRAGELRGLKTRGGRWRFEPQEVDRLLARMRARQQGEVA